MCVEYGSKTNSWTYLIAQFHLNSSIYKVPHLSGELIRKATFTSSHYRSIVPAQVYNWVVVTVINPLTVAE